MADMEPTNRPEEAGRPASRRGGAQAGATEAEPRAFEAPGREPAREGMTAARDMARSAAEQTRAAGERGRALTREAAGNWRAAAEPFMAMHMEMNRWFDELWRQAAGFGALPSLHTARPFLASPASMLGLPPTDIMETDGAYKLCIELPGLTDDNIDLQIRGDALLVSGHKSEDKANAGSTFRISERRFGSFERTFPIPPDVDRDKIEAAFRDGVLTVTLPKSAEAGPARRTIEIKREART